MTVVQFPNTYLSERGWRKWRSCFEQIAIYQPDEIHVPEAVRDLVDSGGLCLRFPVKEKQDELDRMQRAFFQWAAVQGRNMGPAAALAHFGADPAKSVPGDSVLRIRNEIRRVSKGVVENRSGDPMLRCRLFLLIAQDYDGHQEAIRADLMRVKNMEASLREALGDDAEKRPQPSAEPFSDEATPEFMPLERLAAWVPMLIRDYENGERPLPAAFVTSSRDIVSAMLAAAPADARIDTLGHIIATGHGAADGGPAVTPASSAGRCLIELANRPAEEPLPGRPANTTNFSRESNDAPLVLMLPRVHPLDFFRRFAAPGSDSLDCGFHCRGSVRHTIIAFFPSSSGSIGRNGAAT